ncbi:MAG: GNAT family N-acetyltransferase [Chloroflexi bacterium]|jgi:ribosomal protein S18 acetylase RimI-like enzyme|nr:GNAT family N-acetyltransferase [Chloroflexota bacterium]
MFDVQVKILEFSFPRDYDGALKLWRGMELGVQVGRSDAPEEIIKKLQRDPDLFLIAEINNEIVGTIIGGYDGRRGMIYHLAVHASVREQGIASSLLNEVEKRLKTKGCLKCYLLIDADNEDAAQFYIKRDWYEMKADRIFGKELS